jgi:hypothetical protein
MAKSTPFISTKPLDIVAFSFTGLTLMLVILYSLIVWTALSGYAPFFPGLNLTLAFNTNGYNLLFVQGTRNQKGFGFIVKDGIRIWKYKRLSDGQREEIQIYPD